MRAADERVRASASGADGLAGLHDAKCRRSRRALSAVWRHHAREWPEPDGDEHARLCRDAPELSRRRDSDDAWIVDCHRQPDDRRRARRVTGRRLHACAWSGDAVDSARSSRPISTSPFATRGSSRDARSPISAWRRTRSSMRDDGIGVHPSAPDGHRVDGGAGGVRAARPRRHDAHRPPPMPTRSPGATMPDMSMSGELAFPYEFPKPGRYRIWVQVKPTRECSPAPSTWTSVEPTRAPASSSRSPIVAAAHLRSAGLLAASSARRSVERETRSSSSRLDSAAVDVAALPHDTALARFRRVRVSGTPDYEHELIFAARDRTRDRRASIFSRRFAFPGAIPR